MKHPRLSPEDRQIREAIGAVCVHWSNLELVVEKLFATLKGDHQYICYKDYLVRRLNPLKDLVKEKMSHEDYVRICEITDRIKKIAEDRNRIVHSLWVTDTKGEIISLHLGSTEGLIVQPERPMNVDTMREVKLAIAKVFQEVCQFVDLNGITTVKPRKIKSQKKSSASGADSE